METKSLFLTVDMLREISNYGHWIPICNGYTDEYFQENFPGWRWNDLIPKLLKQGIVTWSPGPDDQKLNQGLWLLSGVRTITASKQGNRVILTAEFEENFHLDTI